MNFPILKKIKQKKIKVGVIGLGYVGLPLLKLISDKKIEVFGFDINKNKINLLKKNKSYISDIKNNDIKKIKKNFFSKENFNQLMKCDIIILCLPTPLNKNLAPDMSFVKKLFYEIKFFLRKGQTIILESTVYPGATENIFLDYLNKKFEIGKDFFLCYSPERINPGVEGKIKYVDTTKVVSGYTNNCKVLAANFYKLLFKKVHLAENIRIAETSKLYENAYRSVNIGLANQMKMIADKMKINIHKVIDASSTKPFGFTKFIPGPGLGGHCIPIDPIFLSWTAKKYKSNAKFIDLARKVNLDVTNWIIKKIFSYIKKNKLKKILILGMAYKANVNDDRESPSKIIFEFIKKKRIVVDFFDPLINKTIINNKSFTSLKKIDKKKIKYYDAIIVCTDHNNINYNMVYKNAKLIFDTRGVYSKYSNNKIIHC